ncbi:PepSY domain-containing protein [Bowmanella yangjiangensis]|uniref:PepSY domain-containing protein n=1 Tax=Bowmanella yangjiangensis TaxID=2811230 RepID=UPI0038CBFB53
MMKLGKILIFTLGCMLATTSQAYPQNKEQLDEAQAAKRAKQQVDGRVLKVEPQKDNYRVKVLQKNGRVVTVDVDKKSGKVRPSKDNKDRK